MRKLGLIALAASAAVVPVSAQTVPDADPFYGMPELRLNIPAAVAATPTPAPVVMAPPAAAVVAAAQAPAEIAASTVAAAASAAAPQMGPRPHVAPAPVIRHMRHAAPPRARMPHQPVKIMRHGGTRTHHVISNVNHHRTNVRRFHHIRRIDRGGFVPHFWWGPQVHVRNWGMYGFPAPVHDQRWIRYYDDALLIDREGRVHDGRYGWDWDRYGDRWSYDDRGVPVYVGEGDFEPYGRDYDWAEEWEERGDRDYAHDRGPPLPPECRDAPCTRPHHGPPPLPRAYGYGGYGYGHGCACWPMMMVTETTTTTTTTPVVETRTYYEYVTEKVKAPRRHVRKPVRRAPPPPRPGERG